MKVRYTLPVRGTLQLLADGVARFPDFVVSLRANGETGFVESIEFEILNVPKERWPTLVPAKQDPNAKIPRFPFSVNPDVVSFRTLIPGVINLESLLGLHGLEEIELNRVKEEWLSEPGDEEIGLRQGWEQMASQRVAFAYPISNERLADLVVLSNVQEKETAALAHFRAGLSLFFETRYIDSIRYLYLCIEYLYANGNHKKKQTLAAFKESGKLAASIEHTLSSVHAAQSALARLAKKYPALSGPVSPGAFLEWAFQLRGSIQHGNPNGPNQWHPSRQRDFEHECVLLLNVAHDICCDVADDLARTKFSAPES